MSKKRAADQSFGQIVADARTKAAHDIGITDALKRQGSTGAVVRNMLNTDEISDLLRTNGAVRFWITDCFHYVIAQVDVTQSFRYWKDEVKSRLLTDGKFCREDWPDGYAYLAAERASPFDEPIIELMRCD